MADLLKDTFTYEKLANKYGSFKLPAVKVFVDGKDVLFANKLFLAEADIQLSLKQASSAVIKLADIYDVKNNKITKNVKSVFKLGTIVEVAIGYKSETQTVLKGFVALVGFEYSETPLFVVTIMDVRRLMMVSGSQFVLHDVKNYSDAFNAVMEKYSKLCSLQVDATDDKLEKPISQTANDYEFVTKTLVEAGKSDREFLVVGGKAYFRKTDKKGSPIMKMHLNRELLSFQMDCAYMDAKIIISGYDPFERKAVTSEATVKSSNDLTSILNPAPTLIISDPDADNADKAKTRAESIAKTEKDKTRKGHFVCIGLPELVPGRMVEVEKADAMLNNKYYITDVRHKFNEDFYETELEIRGWE